MGRRSFSLCIALSLIAAGCGGSSDEASAPASSASSVPTTESVTTEPIATEPLATAPATDAVPVTEAATTDPVDGAPGALPATGGDVAPLVPEAVCVERDFRVVFGYDNQSTDVVVLDGAASRLSNVDPADEPFVPTVFAPGPVSRAFVALPGASVADPHEVTWELTGPDGVVRSAHAGDDTPWCDELPPTSGGPEPRTPVLEVSNAQVSDAGEITLDVALTGVPELSVCNPAFQAEPVVIRFEDAEDRVLAEGPTVTGVTAPVVEYRSIGPAAPVHLSVVVIDRCSYDGTTFSAWPTEAALEALLLNDVVCVTVPPGADPQASDEICSDLPATGGSMIRNG